MACAGFQSDASGRMLLHGADDVPYHTVLLRTVRSDELLLRAVAVHHCKIDRPGVNHTRRERA